MSIDDIEQNCVMFFEGGDDGSCVIAGANNDEHFDRVFGHTSSFPASMSLSMFV